MTDGCRTKLATYTSLQLKRETMRLAEQSQTPFSPQSWPSGNFMSPEIRTLWSLNRAFVELVTPGK